MPEQLTDDTLYTCTTFPVQTEETADSGELTHNAMVRTLIACAPGSAWRFWSGIGYADGLQVMGDLNLYHPTLGPCPAPHDSLNCDEDGRVWLSVATVDGLLQRSAAGDVVDLAAVTGSRWEDLISQTSQTQAPFRLHS